MKVIKNLWSFFIYSNLFIAVCAALMVKQSYDLLLIIPSDFNFITFVFFSTLCSYSFHWYFSDNSVIQSERLNWVEKFRSIHLFFFISGLAGTALFISGLLNFWSWLLPAAIATFLYSAPKIPNKYLRWLRKFAWGKTIFLAAVWTYVTAVLPVLFSGKVWDASITCFIGSRYFLTYAICILFDLRDKEDDKAAGIRSFIIYLSEKNIQLLFTFSLLLFTVFTMLLYNQGFGLTDISLLLIPGILLSLLYTKASRNFSDMLYYFTLDGLLALSSILTLLARI